ncbi:MAG: hypothetical protein LBS23_00075 [Holosporaceae bacterium]|jgi:hypothetical protein|nr:hypothetical protein [Holosporaceae bacterium]
MVKIISEYFGDFGKVFLKNLSGIILGLMRSESAGVASIARSLSQENGQTFKANEKRVNRFLQDKDFQVDDAFWRKYVNLLFDSLTERGLLKIGDNVLIKVDYTTDRGDFLILEASVDFGGRSVPLYFSMRLYPKRNGQSDQKKMEAAFVKELRHILSKKYTYTIVADRGFGNNRFAQLCEKCGFDYVLRICENLNIQIDGNSLNLKNFCGLNLIRNLQKTFFNRPSAKLLKQRLSDLWVIFPTNHMPKVHRMGFKMDFFRRKLDKHTKMSDHTFAEGLV